MTQRHAEIAGAGLAGLTVATVLAGRGWSVRVHERAPELREIGAGIFVWENGLRVLEAIGAAEEATRRAEPIRQWQVHDERGKPIQGAWMQGDVRLSLILRTDLHRALANAATRAGVEIVTGSTVAYASEGGQVWLEDGSSAEADVVVGADGVFSRVRDHLQLGLVARDLQDGCGRHLIRREPGDPVEKTLEYWDGGRRIGICPCSPEHVYVYLCCPANDAEGRAKPLNRRSWTASFPMFEHVLERIPDEGRWANFYDVVCRSWSAGRVAIVGDAAHAMSPNLGQGACVAMTSALALGQALDVHDQVPSALAAWERAERPIVDATQRYSRLYGRIGTSWPRPALRLRSALTWGIGRSQSIQRRANVAAHHFPALDQHER